MKLNFATLDVFTTTRYTGNPVAIASINELPMPSERDGRVKMSHAFSMSGMSA